MRHFILALLLLLSASALYAEEVPLANDEPPITDWPTLLKALEARGVDTFSIDWIPVENACSYYKDGNEEKYNRCRLEKAVLYNNFISDQKSCHAMAEGEFPDGLLSSGQDATLTVTEDGKTRTILVQKAPVSAADLQKIRRNYYYKCMTNLNWQSADNWATGYRSRPKN